MWQVRSIGLSWNCKVLQWINLNESFTPCYIRYEDLCEEILKKFVRVVSEIYKKALKVQILNEVALRQVVRKLWCSISAKNQTYDSISNFTVVTIGLLTQHPTLQLSTPDFKVGNIGLLTHHPTLQLLTSDCWLNIQLISYRQQTIDLTFNFTVVNNRLLSQYPTKRG